MQFENECKRKVWTGSEYDYDRREERYQFDKPPRLLFFWSRLFQAVISQAGTFLLTGKYHTQDCGIYKCEGGCNMPGAGSLVLSSSGAYWDGYYCKGTSKEMAQRKMNALISEVALSWDPNNPIESMLTSAAAQVKGLTAEELKSAIEKSRCGGAFGGDALSDFFSWNPFSKAPEDRDYLRFTRVQIGGEDPEVVEQSFRDKDLGHDLLQRVQEAVNKAHAGQGYHFNAMCCSPRRMDDGSLKFWINTGRRTQIDGWKTQAEIESFIASGEKLVDSARY